MVGVGQGRDPGSWVMGARGGYSSSSVPVVRCLLEAGPRVAQAFRCPREARNSGLYGKSLEGEEMEEVFLGQRTAMAGVRGGWSMVDQQESLGGSVSCSLCLGQSGKGCGPRWTSP